MQTYRQTWDEGSLERCGLARVSRERAPCFLFLFFFFFFFSVPLVRALGLLEQQQIFRTVLHIKAVVPEITVKLLGSSCVM